MLLRFSDPAKLKTKRIIFEDVLHARDSGTLEQLKELSSRRRVIEESINERSFITEAIAREMAGGLTSKIQRDLQKLEFYLPLLENLVCHVELLKTSTTMLRWVSDLKLRWSSALNGSFTFNLGGSKYFKIDDLRFELGMSIYLYGAHLRERAFETLSEDLLESTTLYRKASGLYKFLATTVLPPLQLVLTKERPPEVVPSMSSVMSLICLAEAQAVIIKKAEEHNGSSGVLSKLHYGITQILEEAASILQSNAGELTDVPARLVEYISLCSILHQLRSQRYFAEDLRSRNQAGTAVGQLGVAIAVLRCAIARIKVLKPPKEESWRLAFTQEVTDTTHILKKLEHENEYVYREKLPDDDQLPILPGLRMVEAIPYESQRWERQLDFVL